MCNILQVGELSTLGIQCWFSLQKSTNSLCQPNLVELKKESNNVPAKVFVKRWLGKLYKNLMWKRNRWLLQQLYLYTDQSLWKMRVKGAELMGIYCTQKVFNPFNTYNNQIVFPLLFFISNGSLTWKIQRLCTSNQTKMQKVTQFFSKLDSSVYLYIHRMLCSFRGYVYYVAFIEFELHWLTDVLFALCLSRTEELILITKHKSQRMWWWRCFTVKWDEGSQTRFTWSVFLCEWERVGNYMALTQCFLLGLHALWTYYSSSEWVSDWLHYIQRWWNLFSTWLKRMYNGTFLAYMLS